MKADLICKCVCVCVCVCVWCCVCVVCETWGCLAFHLSPMPVLTTPTPKSEMRKRALCSPHNYFHFFLCLPISVPSLSPLFLIYDESLPWALGWKLRIWLTHSLWLTHIHLKMSHLLPVQTFYSPTVHSRRQLYSHWARVWARKPRSLWWLYMCTGRRLGSRS